MRERARLLAAAFALVSFASACVRPQTVDVPSPSPYAVPPTASSSAAPSLYSPAPESPETRASQEPSSDDAPQPEGDVAGIRCGDEDQDQVKGTEVVTRTTCYEIDGASMAALDAQMRRKGPRVEGRHAIAVTRWLVRWSYDARSTASGCELIAPSVQTVAVYRFPTWEPSASIAEGAITQYRAFMQEVRKHEGHHRALAVDAGVAIRRALSSLPPAGTCVILGKKADQAFDDIFARYQAKQDAFDEAAGGINY